MDIAAFTTNIINFVVYLQFGLILVVSFAPIWVPILVIRKILK